MGASRFAMFMMAFMGACVPAQDPAPAYPQYGPQYAPQYGGQYAPAYGAAQPPPPQQAAAQQPPAAQPPQAAAQLGSQPAAQPTATAATPSPLVNGMPAASTPAAYAGEPPPAGYGVPTATYPASTYPPPPGYGPADSTQESGRSHLHDGEVIGVFTTVGILASIDVMVRQDVSDGNVVTFGIMAGVGGGFGAGYLLTQKYEVDAGTSHATTLGMLLGIANSALLVEPTGWDRGGSIMNLVFVGSAAGAVGGFAYGHAAKLTAGQSTFIGTMTMLGTATAALGAIAASQDGQFGGGENATLAVGLDGGAVAGAVIAPNLDWSARRSRFVLAGSAIGALGGGMIAAMLTKPKDGESREDNSDVAAGAMTAGMWGGFALSILMTRDDTPDVRPSGTVRTRTAEMMPWVTRSGAVGVMTGGTF